MAKADHLRVFRGPYWHHGIDIGDDSVVHYRGVISEKENAKVIKTSLEDFLLGAKLEIVEYNLDQCYPPEAVVSRALSKLGETKYSLVSNNCEHFARWCKTGEKKSEQVKDTVAGVTDVVVGKVAGTTAAISAVSAAGYAGLSGAGIMSGLSTIGGPAAAASLGAVSATVGGVVTLAAAPALVTNIAMSKTLKDDGKLPNKERKARKAGRIATKAGTAAGAVGTVTTISAAGTTAGLSSAGITSGLAAIGGSGTAIGTTISAVTGLSSMAIGTAICIAAPAVIAAGAGYGIYKLWKRFSKK